MKTPKINHQLIGPLLLVAAQYSNQIIGPLVSLLVVRYLGAERFGLYASAMAITTLLSVLPDFGLQQAALNMNARKEWSITGILRRSLRIGLIYAAITFALVMIWITVVDYQSVTRILAIILAITFFRIAIATVMTTGLQIKGSYGRIALWNGMIGAAQWISTLIAIILKVNIYWLILGPILASLAVSVLMLIVEGKSLIIKQRETSKSSVPSRQLLSGSWQFGLASSMHQLYYKSDVAILSISRQPIEVGHYTVAFRLIELFFLFPGVVFNQVLYPKYCIWIRENLEKLRSYYGFMNKLMIVTGAIVTIMLALIGSDLIRILFGESQSESVKCLLILALAIPLRFWVSSAGAVLTNERLIITKLKIQTGIALFNVTLNALLIPRFGLIAAAINMIVTHIVLLAAYSLAAHRHLFGFDRLKSKDWIPTLVIFGTGLIVNLWIWHLQTLAVKIAGGGILAAMVIFIYFVWFHKNDTNELIQLLKRRESRT